MNEPTRNDMIVKLLLAAVLFASCETSDSSSRRITSSFDTLTGLNEYGSLYRGYEKDDMVSIEKAEQGHHFHLCVMKARFDTEEHDVSMIRENIIDGERFYGTDGSIPKHRIKEMRLLIDGKEIEIPSETYSPYYDPNLGYGRGNQYVDAYWSTDYKGVFVLMNGGDGAGAYTIAWDLRSDGDHRSFVAHDDVHFRFPHGPR